tara:strand:+ start:177 stop:494 length:318 start_codon:yes stop_codon:yes gene_type:complete
MGEKRGNTEKLLYPFNTAGCLEIYLKEKWYRATAREFRSFNGLRRITEPVKIEHRNVDVPMKTYDYWGPVYLFGTNKVMEFTNTGSMYTGEKWEAARKNSEERGR